MQKKEGTNNLFWQIMKTRDKSPNQGWSGNLFCGGCICLSALRTPSNFLLLSEGSVSAAKAMAGYSMKWKWNMDGVCGPESVVHPFIEESNRIGSPRRPVSNRAFRIFRTRCNPGDPKFEDYELVTVSKLDWPRARIWSQRFAMEADPPLDLSAITQMAKRMHLEKNLFVLRNSQNHPCAMAGFGRFTERFSVINMVYVPYETRGLGIGRELIIRMSLLARELGYENCLLFSDWKGSSNMYSAMGCESLGGFVEYELA